MVPPDQRSRLSLRFHAFGMRFRRLLTAIHRASLVLGVGLLVSLIHVSSAAASTARVRAVIPRVDTVQVGPIAAKHGFSLYLTAQDCGSSDPYLQLAYRKASAGEVLSHTYTGAGFSCAIRPSGAGAVLRVSLAGLINVAVQVTTGARAPLAHPGLPVGCGAPFGPELPGTATGLIDVAIHPGVFGQISAATASAQIFSGAPQQCPAAQPVDGRELTAAVGPYILDADQPEHGAAQLDILDPSGDLPGPGLAGTLEVQMSGRAALRVEPATGSTQIGATTGLTAGALDFTALAACPGSRSENGELSGTLTIEDPLLGALRINGGEASRAFTGLGLSQPGDCNGPGSAPVVPDIISTCPEGGPGCSVAAQSSTTTFFDETSPGTQTITSEVVNFGDGSPTVPVDNYGNLQHLYAEPGTYTVTLTVTDAVGTVNTVSTTVVIEP